MIGDTGSSLSASALRVPEIAEEERLRAATYSLLGRLLARAPEAPLLEQLAQAEGDLAEEGLEGAWAELSQAARRAELSALDDEYHALFIGVGRGELVPFGSWYITGFLMERPLSELRDELRLLGIERCADVHEPEDHIGALCDVMALLISDPGYQLEAQRGFYTRHLSLWAGDFFKDLERAKCACFYRSVGRLGRAFLILEERCHNELN
jgi:TorA maturation chaperone TorD